jgi:hypothetical protein
MNFGGENAMALIVAVIILVLAGPVAGILLTALLLLVGYIAGQPMVAEAGKMFGLVTLAYILIVVVLLGIVLGSTAGAVLRG